MRKIWTELTDRPDLTCFVDLDISAWLELIRIADDLCLGSLAYSWIGSNSHMGSATYLEFNRWPMELVDTGAAPAVGIELRSRQRMLAGLMSRWRISRSRRSPLRTRSDWILKLIVACDMTHPQIDHIMHRLPSEAFQCPWNLSLYLKGRCESYTGLSTSSVDQRT